MLRCKMQNLFNQPICKRKVLAEKQTNDTFYNQKQVPSIIGKYLTYVHGRFNKLIKGYR